MKLPKVNIKYLKWAAVIVVIILAILLIKKLFGKNSMIGNFFNWFSYADEKKEANKRVGNSDKPQTGNMSFSMQKAKYYADSLEIAMNPHKGFMPASYDGTDEQAIYDIFDKIITRDDMLAVFRAFGARDYDRGYINRTYKDLISWLKKDLDTSEYRKIEPKLILM